MSLATPASLLGAHRAAPLWTVVWPATALGPACCVSRVLRVIRITAPAKPWPAALPPPPPPPPHRALASSWGRTSPTGESDVARCGRAGLGPEGHDAHSVSVQDMLPARPKVNRNPFERNFCTRWGGGEGMAGTPLLPAPPRPALETPWVLRYGRVRGAGQTRHRRPPVAKSASAARSGSACEVGNRPANCTRLRGGLPSRGQEVYLSPQHFGKNADREARTCGLPSDHSGAVGRCGTRSPSAPPGRPKALPSLQLRLPACAAASPAPALRRRSLGPTGPVRSGSQRCQLHAGSVTCFLFVSRLFLSGVGQ